MRKRFNFHTQPFWALLIACFFAFSFTPNPLIGQQIEVPRISTMPDIPEPYLMRDWQAVAHGYDSLVFDSDLSGQYLPVLFFRDQSVNYPDDESFGLHTAIGTNHPTSGEAINVIPAVVGATLAGIDKSDQFDENWALMIQEFFNKRPEENIYLNHPATQSGHDWWYESMPNIFYMQLKYLYPEIAVFDEQLPVMASRWKEAVMAMGASDTPWQVPYMNYRAWNMSEMEPLDSGVRQPEAAGALAWIFYNTYVATGDASYLKAAEWSMEFLDAWPDNPSYELQLPYGIYTAARMNAEIGTGYDIEKMVNWAFIRGDLRGWGAISGTWGGLDCHGLIGEANDNGNDYAFMMNGFQQAAALVPMIRYDHRFAHDIAKWVLNMANASRLFYPNYMPEHMQDNAGWAQTHDPDSYIAYEALREIKHGYSPYATGDAIDGGWAQTNLMLYGSSHVGYMAGIIHTTNVEGILKLDLLKTDFFKQEALPTYLYYNPFSTIKTIHASLPEGTYKIYDVISKQIIAENQSHQAAISIPSKGVVMPVIVPQESVIQVQGRKTLADDIIIDFNNGQDTGALPPRIKSLAASDTILITEGTTTIFCTATDQEESLLTYHWFFPEEDFMGDDQQLFTAPDETGFYSIACKVTNDYGLSDSLAITIEVVETIPYPPVIHNITATPRKIKPDAQAELLAEASDFHDEPLDYHWQTTAGDISQNGETAIYTAPAEAGNYFITLLVSNPDGLTATDSMEVMVRTYDDNPGETPVAFYPLRGNTNDYGGNELHASSGGGLSYTSDMNNIDNYAAHFNGTSAYVLMPESYLFDFTEQLSISAFMKTTGHTPHEQHPISHGSWEHRYKLSIGDSKLRFTLNTDDGIRDLDTETVIEAGKWYHVAAVYDGHDMEIWLNGELDAFVSHTGAIGSSPWPIVLGQNIPGNNNYNYYGDMAMLQFFDFALTPTMISDSLSLNVPGIIPGHKAKLNLFPNPVSGDQLNIFIEEADLNNMSVYVYDMHGRLHVQEVFSRISENEIIELQLPVHLNDGMYLLRIVSGDNLLNGMFVVNRR